MKTPSILFVCLGNICRSPLAEAAMRDAAARAGLEIMVDSAGTGEWHVGHPPDERAVAVAARHGIDISSYKARQVRGEDFRSFDHILALDPQNLRDLRKIAPSDTSARLALLLDHVPGRMGEGVSDPYYQDDIAFELVWRDVSVAAEALVAVMRGD
ncbi:low molecular weight phosphotyrosine protein phosphatase [Sphingomonas sp. LB-2]|uniref:low molecular weight protein-tyrosine-phosphatase n=1 Tax=Sphingomonas caeni TaxID=2984949 RepID=UPI00222E538C|nr:low molecular weight protein-tyrosine-phosphatase [Sphingomonas caeni]MCW3848552.1 low molecular weight phosphotyrosine protein phosphatase [Sphingomonas caeni]